jgi:hypothetical protein
MINKKYICPPGHEDLTENFKREIFDEFEYDRFGVKVEEGDIVLDCGGNIGIFTDYALSRGALKIFSYEADREIFECYNKNILNPDVYPTLGFVGKDDHTISKILNQHNISRIDFAKIDIEGSEWDLFENMTDEELCSIDKWAIEFHTLYYNLNVDEEIKKNKLWDFLKILEKFSKNNFRIYYEHIHKGWDIVHLYAIKK